MREEISRLVDGELPPEEFDVACSELKRADGMATWVCYHVIGESLRGTPQVNPGFAQRFTARLSAEPVVLAPKPRVRHPLNYVWAAAAGIAAVAVTGWVAVSVIDPGPAVSAVAKAREAAAVRAAQVRPAAVPQDYLLAHQEYSPTTPIPTLGPAIVPISVSSDVAR
jgi:sigma-E factor negative regulatory protein RseA